MSIVRREDRPDVVRGHGLPRLQRLVDGDNGSTAMTVLVNTFRGEETVPEHVHDVEEVLVVVEGDCTVTIDGQAVTAHTGDAVIVAPGSRHSIGHTSPEVCRVVGVLGSPDVHIPSHGHASG